MSELYLQKEPSLFGYAEILAEFGETVVQYNTIKWAR